MKAKTLMDMARSCDTEEQLAALLSALVAAFSEAQPLKHLHVFNQDSAMEAQRDRPFVQFELSKEISEHYVSTIRPEIRNGEMVVVVIMCHMLDGKGFSSQNWEVVEGMEDVIEVDENRTILGIARQAKTRAIANHAELIERLGVPHNIALSAARKSW